MTTTPLPRKPTGKLAFAYQTIAALEQARADLEAENQRLREALRIERDHIDMNALRVSHCKDATTITAALKEQP